MGWFPECFRGVSRLFTCSSVFTLCFKEVTRFSKEVIRVFHGFFRV